MLHGLFLTTFIRKGKKPREQELKEQVEVSRLNKASQRQKHRKEGKFSF